jgi:PAS domain S-box-containing protein
VWVRQDGRRIEVSITISPIIDAQGQIVGASTIARDITARKQAEAERERLLTDLDESRRLFQSITETSPYLFYVADLDTRSTIYVNARSKQAFGYTADELVALGDRFAATLWHPDDLAGLPEHRRKLHGLADGEIYETEHRTLHPDGTYQTSGS